MGGLVSWLCVCWLCVCWLVGWLLVGWLVDGLAGCVVGCVMVGLCNGWLAVCFGLVGWLVGWLVGDGAMGVMVREEGDREGRPFDQNMGFGFSENLCSF